MHYFVLVLTILYLFYQINIYILEFIEFWWMQAFPKQLSNKSAIFCIGFDELNCTGNYVTS